MFFVFFCFFEVYVLNLSFRRRQVISMCDVLEHLPWPRPALRKAHTLLAAGGLLFLSMPNRDSLPWRLMDQAGTNVYVDRHQRGCPAS